MSLGKAGRTATGARILPILHATVTKRTQEKARPEPGFLELHAGEPAPDHQNEMRGPMNSWVSPSANFTSPETPHIGLNFTCAPMRP